MAGNSEKRHRKKMAKMKMKERNGVKYGENKENENEKKKISEVIMANEINDCGASSAASK